MLIPSFFFWFSAKSQSKIFERKAIVLQATHDVGKPLANSFKSRNIRQQTIHRYFLPTVMVEYGMTNRVGTGIKFSYYNMNKGIQETTNSSSVKVKGFSAFTFAQYHFGKQKSLDYSVGIGAGYFRENTKEANSFTNGQVIHSNRIENGFSFSVKSGARYYFSQNTAFVLELEYPAFPSFLSVGMACKINNF